MKVSILCEIPPTIRLIFIKALRAIAEQDDDQHGPLVAYPRQNGPEGAAIFGVGDRERNGHPGVPWYQICAFLRTMCRYLT